MTEKSFDWVSLDPDEEIEWSGEPRMHSIIPALVVGIPLSVFGIGIVIIIAAYLQIKNTDFVVTNQGLYRKKGVLSRSVKKIGFDKVQNISFSQGIFGNFFGYGNIDISTAGSSGVEMRFNSIDSPKEVQELINRRIKDERTDVGPEQVTEKELLKQILNELGNIRETLEKE